MYEDTLSKKVIVIDPGHGGNDPGSIGPNGTREKDITLKTAKNIQKKLEEKGMTVILTREDDTFVPLKNRVAIAQNKSADLFLSIHYDGFTTNDVKGVTTYYYKGLKEQALAKMIHDHLFKHIQAKNRGVKSGDYYVLRENQQPSILLELGYITNPEDEERMNSQKSQADVASGVISGIIEYFNR
ncbi:N-acetylmuramoyl-L-alanine amidase [Bacillus pseudomycoides]|nr:N-acetylmuramoyl-L-alanine amidase [Bacillus pseudomycoides]PEA84485.1 N-acetylmuramoyl-L-alanine amidase [Bacillus pseudomycoides]PED74084.1 N-acetylmuramoyl-L-alanine amidase [Bacillus pseudomycoides]PEI42932.1 N-acetylmuramoyl-L-alanine amidase [Bacillus pseudomycoides]PEJ80480.1 N-acetylmuramoyl-L-alanine amidase [Bacillus pseudomycoides]